LVVTSTAEIHAVEARPVLRDLAQLGMSNLPSGAWTTTPLGAPPSRTRRVIARVSTPHIPGQIVALQPVVGAACAANWAGSVDVAAQHHASARRD